MGKNLTFWGKRMAERNAVRGGTWIFRSLTESTAWKRRSRAFESQNQRVPVFPEKNEWQGSSFTGRRFR
jgi:hypothetical protein